MLVYDIKNSLLFLANSRLHIQLASIAPTVTFYHLHSIQKRLLYDMDTLSLAKLNIKFLKGTKSAIVDKSF